MAELKLWRWRYTDDFGQRRVTRYVLSEDEARSRLREPVRIEASIEIRVAVGPTGDFM